MVVVFLISILFGCSLAMIFVEYSRRKSAASRQCRSIDSLILRCVFPLILKFSFLFENRFFRAYKDYLTPKLIKSGLCKKLRSEEFCAYQLVLFIIFNFIITILFGIIFTGLFVSLLVGFFYPLIWLFSLERERRREISVSLPQILDLLSLSVEAGMDFLSATERIVKNGADSLLVNELLRMVSNIKIGKSRKDALLELKKRLSHPAVDSFVSMLVQADRMGTSIAPVLKANSAKLRSERFQRAEKMGIIAAQKIMMPLVFCIMPAVFIVVFAPLIIMWRTGTIEKMFYGY